MSRRLAPLVVLAGLTLAGCGGAHKKAPVVPASVVGKTGANLVIATNATKAKADFRCTPAGGTGVQTCSAAKLTQLAKLMQASADGTKPAGCDQVYVGPEEAAVSGRVLGQDYNILFTQQNNCAAAAYAQLLHLTATK